MVKFINLMLVLGLAGCASGGSTSAGYSGSGMTSAQQRANMYQQSLNSSFAPLQACLQQVALDPRHNPAIQIFPLTNVSSMAVAQLSNPSRPTAADMRRIVSLAQDRDQCWKNNSSAMRSVDPAISNSIDGHIRNINLIIADMARGRLSLGDANRRVQSEDARMAQLMGAHRQQVGAMFAQQNQAELAMRQAQAARQEAEMAALGAQIQQMSREFNANAQATLYNSSQFVTPQVQSFSPPSNRIVNCYQTGPIVNCR